MDVLDRPYGVGMRIQKNCPVGSKECSNKSGTVNGFVSCCPRDSKCSTSNGVYCCPDDMEESECRELVIDGAHCANETWSMFASGLNGGLFCCEAQDVGWWGRLSGNGGYVGCGPDGPSSSNEYVVTPMAQTLPSGTVSPTTAPSSTAALPTSASATSETTTATSTPAPTNGDQSTPSNRTGAIAGGVVGGVAGLALIAAVIFFLLRRRRRRPEPAPPVAVVSPHKPINELAGKAMPHELEGQQRGELDTQSPPWQQHDQSKRFELP